MKTFLRLGLATVPVLFTLAACSLSVDSTVGGGVGDLCKAASDCQGADALCDNGVCSRSCTAATECPTGSSCFGGKCGRSLKAGFIYVGAPGDEGWTLTHDLGKKFAENASPYLTTASVDNTFLDGPAKLEMDKMIKDGANVIFATSDSLRKAASEKADEYPNVQFLVCSGTETKKNLSGYFGRSYQAWYIAGAAAATKSKTGRIGFMGSNVNPELVRHINAFTRGAQSVSPTIKVEVVWEGFWFDQDPPTEWTNPLTGMKEMASREVQITADLIQHGCDVIGHGSDNSRPIDTVEKFALSEDFYRAGVKGPNPYKGKVFSIGNDNVDGCRRGPKSCLGSFYWNWGPLYVNILDKIRRGTWESQIVNEYIDREESRSLFSFGTSKDVNVLTQPEVQAISNALSDMATRSKDPFRGPLRLSTNPNNQKVGPTGPAGEVLTKATDLPDSELSQMCWFVDGIVTYNPTTKQDEPASVPQGDLVIESNLTFDKAPDCTKNR